MVDYLTDIAIDEHRDIYIDGANDLATISGKPNLEQSIALSTLDVTRRYIGRKVTAEDLGLLEERVREYLEQDPHIGSIVSVETETFNRDSGIVTMRVELTESESFTVELETE